MSERANRYFKWNEFKCKCGACEYNTGREIFPMIPKLCFEIRVALDRPVRVNSACRCDEHNDRVSGSPNSQHLGRNDFRAVDLNIFNAVERAIAIEIALGMGASVGVHRKFTHFDFRENGPIIFLY